MLLFKKTFSYAGFEQQPKEFLNAKILLLNVELELKSEKEKRRSEYFVYRDIFSAGRVAEEDLQRVAAARVCGAYFEEHIHVIRYWLPFVGNDVCTEEEFRVNYIIDLINCFINE